MVLMFEQVFYVIQSTFCLCEMEHVNEYPTMHYYEIPGHTQSMIAYKILTKYFWKFQ